MSDAPVFNLDPVLATIPYLGLQLRYYGLIFAAMLYIGFLLWRWQMLRGGHKPEIADKYLIWGVIAVLLGSRLGPSRISCGGRYPGLGRRPAPDRE